MNRGKERRARHRNHGLSILEVIIGLALSAIVLVGIHSSYSSQVYALQSHNAAFALQDLARGALDLMVREIRMAGYDPSGAALAVSPGPACPGVSQGLTEATATRVHILADLNGDGTTTGANEDLTYDLVNVPFDQIVRTDSGNSVMLTDNVATNGLAFRYFDGSDPPVELVPAPSLTAAQRDCVTTVSVVVRLTAENPSPKVSSYLTSEASSQVAIRSRALMNF